MGSFGGTIGKTREIRRVIAKVSKKHRHSRPWETEKHRDLG